MLLQNYKKYIELLRSTIYGNVLGALCGVVLVVVAGIDCKDRSRKRKRNGTVAVAKLEAGLTLTQDGLEVSSVMLCW